MRIRTLGCALLVATLTGCAMGQKTNYHEGKSNFVNNFTGAQALQIVVVDKRPYVLSGDKSASFTGLLRSLAGIPYSTYTESGNPLALDLAGLFERSLTSPGSAPIRSAVAKPADDLAQFVVATSRPEEKSLVFVLSEWKADISGVGNGLFHHDVTLDVFTHKGAKLATATIKGRERFDGSDPLSNAIARVMQALLSDINIVQAVNDPNAVAPTPTQKTKAIEEPGAAAKTCSVAQILEMEKIGISQEQIEAACGK